MPESNEADEDEEHRGRGFLTPDDRGYLKGEKDYSPNVERNRRGQIRERVINAIKDFELVAHHLETRDVRQVFDSHGESDQFKRGLKNAFAFLYLGARYTKNDINEMIEEEISLGEMEYQTRFEDKWVDVNTELDIEITDTDPLKGAIERLKNEEPLSVQDILGLLGIAETRDEDISHIDKVRYDDSDLGFPIHREVMQREILEPVLTQWHNRPDTVKVERNNSFSGDFREMYRRHL